MGFVSSVAEQVAAAPAAGIFNTEGLKGQLMSLLGVAVVGIALVALLSFGSKRSGMRDVLQVVGAVVLVLVIVGLGALVGTDAGRTMVSTIFNFG